MFACEIIYEATFTHLAVVREANIIVVDINVSTHGPILVDKPIACVSYVK